MSLYTLLDEMREALRPESDDLLKERDAVLDSINASLKKRDVDAIAVGGGSVAKNTYVSGDHDIDIFVRFSLEKYGLQEEVLPDILEKVLKEFSPERIHGSRDYFQFRIKDFDFEVVPVLAVEHSGEARNVTDMSPLHVEYFHLKGKDINDEVRLLKQFCKSAGVYGAESYIRGFSGHVIDLLIIHYGDFYTMIKEAARWKEPVVIDVEGHHADPRQAIDVVKHAPLIIVDPVQPERNAAAALSNEQYALFRERARAFIKNPSTNFFVVQSFSEDVLRKKLLGVNGAAVIVTATHDKDDKEDVAGARIRKVFEQIQKKFVKEGFTLVGDGWNFVFGGKSILWFVTKEHSLPRMAERAGPPIAQKEDAKKFRETHKEVTEKKSRLYAKVERRITRPEEVPQKISLRVRDAQNVSLDIERLT